MSMSESLFEAGGVGLNVLWYFFLRGRHRWKEEEFGEGSKRVLEGAVVLFRIRRANNKSFHLQRVKVPLLV